MLMGLHVRLCRQLDSQDHKEPGHREHKWPQICTVVVAIVIVGGVEMNVIIIWGHVSNCIRKQIAKGSGDKNWHKIDPKDLT